LTLLQAAAFDLPLIRSKPTHEKQYDEDDQDDADETDAAMTVTVAVAAEATTEATEQENDEDDDKNESQRHDLSPVAASSRTLNLFALRGYSQLTPARRACDACYFFAKSKKIDRVKNTRELLRDIEISQIIFGA
jgi:hypothetical protein